MARRLFSEEEIEEIAAFAVGERRLGREKLRDLAAWLEREYALVARKVREARQVRQASLTGVMTGCGGITHAELIGQMRRGVR